eukprot:828060-Rhodomonas_salina.3
MPWKHAGYLEPRLTHPAAFGVVDMRRAQRLARVREQRKALSSYTPKRKTMRCPAYDECVPLHGRGEGTANLRRARAYADRDSTAHKHTTTPPTTPVKRTLPPV